MLHSSTLWAETVLTKTLQPLQVRNSDLHELKHQDCLSMLKADLCVLLFSFSPDGALALTRYDTHKESRQLLVVVVGLLLQPPKPSSLRAQHINLHTETSA